uniref:Uncharacterized protein n=1 Tax=Graphocephala atropunctata TaxID=36148 RepID=A0A1B6L8I5_9HEMI
MSGGRKLNDLLTQRPFDPYQIERYGRSKKVDVNELIAIAVTFSKMENHTKHGKDLTPLQVACSRSKSDIVSLLVKEGTSVNLDNIMGSPLHIALEHGNIPVVQKLIELGADIESMCSSGNTPMVSAMSTFKKEEGCVTAVKLLLEYGVSVNAIVESKFQQKAIHVAVCNNLPSVVTLLLNMNADPSATDKDGTTPLHIAVFNNRVEIIKLLSLHNVDFYKENYMGDSPLVFAVKCQVLQNIETLIRCGCDPNKISPRGHSLPLHSAANLCNLDIVKLLVNLGADVNLPVEGESTPLHTVAQRLLTGTGPISEDKAKSQKRKDIAEFLVERGAKLNTTDASMNTPL